MSGLINMQKQKKRGGSLLVVLLILLFAAASVCACVTAERFGLKLDLTENRLYELTDTTYDLVDGLTKPVTVTVFNTESDFLTLPRELLARYARLSDQLTVRYCDPYAEPQLVQSYREKGYKIELNSILVESGSRIRFLKLLDLYEMDSSGKKVKGLVAEQMLTSAIACVTTEEKSLVQFTDGHNEQPSQALLDLFTRNNYDVSYTMLSVLGVDDSTDTLVITAPTRDFSEEDIAAVEAYLEKGGSVMAFLEPGTTAFPRLFGLLEDWGIGITDNVVREPQMYVSGSRLNVAATYASHPINEYFTGNRYYIIMPSCRALTQLYEKSGGTTTQQVLISSSKSYAQEGTGSEIQSDQDVCGPFALAMTAQRTLTTTEGEKTAHLFVSGSKNLYGDDLLSSDSLANSDFLVQASAWCLGDETLLNISSKDLNTQYLPILAGEARGLAIVLLGAFPAAALAWGVFTYLRRRHL